MFYFSFSPCKFYIYNCNRAVVGMCSGTPEIGGLTTIQALELLRGCQGLNVVGGDVVEVLYLIMSCTYLYQYY